MLQDQFVEVRHGLQIWIDAGTGNEYVQGEPPTDGNCPNCGLPLQSEIAMSSSDGFEYWTVCQSCDLSWSLGEGPAY